MQAQEYALAKWAVGQRAEGLVDADVDRALAEGSIVRTHVLRPTWHFVARDGLRWLLALTGPRVRRKIERRFRQLGLDHRTLGRCASVISSAIAEGNHLTRAQIAALLDRSKIDPSGQRLPFILMHCELEAVICSGGVSGKQHTYALVDERVPQGPPFDRDIALAELARRYLAGHGPATVQDLRWWSSLTVADIREALARLGSDAVSEEIEGIMFWSLGASENVPVSGTGVQLLHPFDELIVGFRESRYFGDPRGETARAAWAGRNLPRGLLLVDGAIAGLWRRTVERDSVAIEVVLYERKTPHLMRSVEAAADDLGRFLQAETSLTVIG
jgi:hypothetical protein